MAVRRRAGTSSSKSKPKARPRPGPRAARPGDNTLEGRAQPYLKRIETKLDALDSERGAYMAKCKVIREDIREVYGEAKDHDVPVKALKGLVEFRVLERKQEKIAASFEDIDEAAAYEQLVEALGPLGMAAARAAGFAPKARRSDEGRDVRPRHLRDAERERENGSEAQRADEAELARVGRGGEPAPAPPPAEAPPAEAESGAESSTPTAH